MIEIKNRKIYRKSLVKSLILDYFFTSLAYKVGAYMGRSFGEDFKNWSPCPVAVAR